MQYHLTDEQYFSIKIFITAPPLLAQKPCNDILVRRDGIALSNIVNYHTSSNISLYYETLYSLWEESVITLNNYIISYLPYYVSIK